MRPRYRRKSIEQKGPRTAGAEYWLTQQVYTLRPLREIYLVQTHKNNDKHKEMSRINSGKPGGNEKPKISLDVHAIIRK